MSGVGWMGPAPAPTSVEMGKDKGVRKWDTWGCHCVLVPGKLGPFAGVIAVGEVPAWLFSGCFGSGRGCS